MARISEQKMRAEIAAARLTPDSDGPAARIYNALKQVYPEGSVYYVLENIPDQCRDIYDILVDDEVVVRFELERGNSAAVPLDVTRSSVFNYQKSIGRSLRQKLKIALEFARKELGRPGT